MKSNVNNDAALCRCVAVKMMGFHALEVTTAGNLSHCYRSTMGITCVG